MKDRGTGGETRDSAGSPGSIGDRRGHRFRVAHVYLAEIEIRVVCAGEIAGVRVPRGDVIVLVQQSPRQRGSDSAAGSRDDHRFHLRAVPSCRFRYRRLYAYPQGRVYRRAPRMTDFPAGRAGAGRCGPVVLARKQLTLLDFLPRSFIFAP
jgi:hypothetical protein